MRKVKIHPAFILIWLLFLLTDKSAYVLYLFLAAAVHETAHICAFMTYGANIEKMEILPFGISVKLRSATFLSCKKEIVASLAGVGVNFLLAGLLSLLPGNLPIDGIPFFILCNLALGIVNLVPIMPLDGGRCVYFILLSKLDPLKASKISLVISYLFLIPLFLLSLYIIVISKYNFSLLLIVIYLLLYLIVKKTD